MVMWLHWKTPNSDVHEFQLQNSNYVPWENKICVSEYQFSNLQNEDKMPLSKWLWELYEVMQV